MTYEDMRRQAFGEMGLLPEQFFRMRYIDFLSCHFGFENKKYYDQKVLRRAVRLILQPYMKSNISDYQIWPLPGDSEEMQRSNAYISEKNRQTLLRFRELEQKQKGGEN